MSTMIKECVVCGGKFVIDKASHYISRDDTVTGIAIIIKDSECSLYDTFDCPYCGCQNIIQKRKREYFSKFIESLEEETEEEEMDCDCSPEMFEPLPELGDDVL